MHAEEEAGGAEPGDRRELGERIDAGFCDQLRRDAERRHRRNQQRVAVGLRRCDRLGADQGAGTGPVVDHDRLAERLLKLIGDQPPQDVGDEPADRAPRS